MTASRVAALCIVSFAAGATSFLLGAYLWADGGLARLRW